MDHLHANRILPKGCNSSFITFIPKRENPQSLGDFHPISLEGCMHKILDKIFTRRLKSVLPSVLDDRQIAFLGGRNILNGVLVTNEVIDEARRKKNKCILFKVDYEKACDLMSWNFLLYMLTGLGFGINGLSGLVSVSCQLIFQCL